MHTVRTETVRTDDGVDLAWYDFGGDGRPLLLCHATGFHAHVWLPAAARLKEAGFHCYAFDQRAQGDSTPPPDGNYAWEQFGRDALAVVDAARLDRPLAVGHSCGGALLLLAEQHRPGSFAAMYLYEPVVRTDGPEHVDHAEPPDASAVSGTGRNLAEGARRRREVFASRQDAYDNYAGKPPFSVLDPEALRAYVDYGFDDLADGTVQLKCRGAEEAAVYEGGARHTAYQHLPEVKCPVTVACGGDTEMFGPAVIEAIAARLADARTEVLPGLGHFGPMEDPAAVAARIVASFP